MNGYECYRTFLALRQHFSKWDYNFHQYNGKVKATPKSFEKRKDKYWFDKLSRMHDPLGRMIAHYSMTNNPFIRDVCQDKNLYLERQGRVESLSYIFNNELKKLLPDFDENFIVRDGQHPYIIKELMGERISLETVAIIVHLTGCVSYWSKYFKNDPLFDAISMKISKIHSFLSYDEERFRNMIISFFQKSVDFC